MKLNKSNHSSCTIVLVSLAGTQTMRFFVCCRYCICTDINYFYSTVSVLICHGVMSNASGQAWHSRTAMASAPHIDDFSNVFSVSKSSRTTEGGIM